MEIRMIELTMQVSEFDYSEMLDNFLPDILKLLEESDSVNPLVKKAVLASPDVSKMMVKMILSSMTQKQKDALTVKFLNVYAPKLCAEVNDLARKHGIVITLDNAQAVYKP